MERYRIAEQTFAEQVGKDAYLAIDLFNEDNPIGRLQAALNSGNYDRIYCIGAKALGSIDTIAPDQNIVFSSVLNWQRFQGQQGISGIASDVAAASQLAMFKYFFPEITTIGVIYSQTNQALINEAKAAARELGLTLVAVKTQDSRLLKEQVTELASSAQALWLISDPVTLSSSEQAKQLLQIADQNALPVFSTHRFFSKLGATFTISADLPTIGRQAAVLIQQNHQIQSNKIHHPVGSYISVNLEKVKQYQLTLNYQALDSVNELLE
ncbi:hypothetical protein GCM10007876_10090 [Litoribrevibacter albus]|uniref:ABC transporter substrate-binding protein n=1 Tax=Litoribrevibacter albus TaxID=1473156 RepID=A0AA37S8A1_9GAMM|nr:hypothetical protein GCM10007876_10090 [Litoribrevibacter albus]